MRTPCVPLPRRGSPGCFGSSKIDLLESYTASSRLRRELLKHLRMAWLRKMLKTTAQY